MGYDFVVRFWSELGNWGGRARIRGNRPEPQRGKTISRSGRVGRRSTRSEDRLGDLVSIAEVVRDLHRASGQPEQSYSERQLYEAALARMAREVAAVEKRRADSRPQARRRHAAEEGGVTFSVIKRETARNFPGLLFRAGSKRLLQHFHLFGIGELDLAGKESASSEEFNRIPDDHASCSPAAPGRPADRPADAAAATASRPDAA